MITEFHNPYNFVRTPARDQKILADTFVGDYDPSQTERGENFSRYWPERYTGEISVRLRTVTPLFITDPGTKKESRQVNGHYIYDCVKEIPATSIKGMLSSAYEIITNSRYRIFSEKQHSQRLGYRYQANAALVPGRISEKNGNFSVTLFTGTSEIGKNRADGPLYAAWLPAYKGKGKLIPPSIKNGDYVKDAELGLYSYSGGRFKLWCVKRIGNINFQPISQKISKTPEKTIRAEGYVVISGKLINRKHDERFFFNVNNENEKNPIQITEDVKKRYEDLIADYQRNHEIKNGRQQNPVNDPYNEGVEFGKHIENSAKLNLKDGDFVYVKTNGMKIDDIYPVQISRELHDVSAWECLDDSLKPADNISKLSPADRLFGWINQNGIGSWKGKIQISAGKYKPSDENTDPLEHFDNNPVTLTILGEPKPSQARFYLGNPDGTPQKNGISKEDAAYKENKHIRGRKVYLHHTLHYLNKEKRSQYWDPFANDNTRREYKLASEPNNQNRSIKSWIPAGRDFYFKIRVENLTREELGALLILFSINNECCFRLGYGKPLGLGSVKLSIDGELAVTTGEKLKERYKDLSYDTKYKLSDFERVNCIKAYQKAIVSAYSGKVFEDIKAPDVLCFEKDLYDILNDGEKKELHEIWLSALENNNENAPIDLIPEKETLLDIFPQKYFDDKYKADLKAWKEYKKQYKNNDFGWKKLDFIKSFLNSMIGFKDAPVMYPYSTEGSEGFQWFSQNERTYKEEIISQNKKIYQTKCKGYSLPVIGQTLEVL